jgi:hypothetical protein
MHKRTLLIAVSSIAFFAIPFLLAFGVQYKILAATTTPTRTLERI